MAKTIKFNLVLDDYPVRNLEGVQEHFSIEDMVQYFRNGFLERWLEIRNYQKELEAVRGIGPDAGDDEVIKQLVTIFNIPIDAADVELAIHVLGYLDEKKRQNAEYRRNSFERNQIVGDYHLGYEELIRQMEEHRGEMPVLKACAIEMEKSYLQLFQVDHARLFNRLMESAPQAVFAILTRTAFRKYWIPVMVEDPDGNEEIAKDPWSNEAREEIFNRIRHELLPVDQLKAILGEDLRVVTRNTQAMWDPIERPEVCIMILRMEKGTFIKNAGNFSEKLGAENVNEMFRRLNGLEYQCNDESLELLYMEV